MGVSLMRFIVSLVVGGLYIIIEIWGLLRSRPYEYALYGVVIGQAVAMRPGRIYSVLYF